MRKYVVAFIIFLILFGSFPAKGFSEGSNEVNENSEYKVIPDEAIRLRILANSDKEDDQELKRDIRDAVNAEITKWVEEIADIEEARQLIQERLGDIEQIVAEELEAREIDQSYQVNYGKDVKFPTKVYGSYVYPAGEYEAILITLGEGKGANWWCVLFPPLCFLDFSSGTSVAEQPEEETPEEEKKKKQDGEKVEFKFFFLDWFA